MSRIVRGVVALLACAALMAGCATVPDTVATVNGVKISGEDYQRTLNGFLANYGLTEETLTQSMDNSQVVEYKNNVIEEMVLQELMLQYAKENGLDTISEQDEADIDEKVQSYLESLKESFESDVESEGTLEGEAAATDAQSRFDEYVSTYGYTEENLRQQFQRELILDRVYEAVMEGCEVTEEDVRAYYDTRLAAEQEKDETDPDGELEEYLSTSTTETAVYVPSKAATDTRYVKHILLQIPSETTEEVDDLRESGDEEGADVLEQQAMDELKTQAEQIRQRALAGEDFDTLIDQYNEDPGMAYNPDGYLVYDGASYDAAFLEDALSLAKPGDISAAPVESSYGYHIIKYVSNPQSGPVAFDEVKDVLKDQLQQEKQEQKWKDAVSMWKEEAQIEKHQFRSEAA